ncbi:hypothetical protein ABZP36_032626 [Zizania latifolia]
MGRGRGRGKKLTTVRSHEDKGSSGEETVPARKRRGRPQKRLADKIDQTDVEKFVENVDGKEGEADDVKLKATRLEKNTTSAAGNKRGRQLKDTSNLVLEESNSSIRSSSDETTRANGFRQIGSRRKSKPRRAAEAGLECK